MIIALSATPKSSSIIPNAQATSGTKTEKAKAALNFIVRPSNVSILTKLAYKLATKSDTKKAV